MVKIINSNKKIIILVLILLSIGYFVYYKYKNNSKEFEEDSNWEELETFEDEKKEENIEKEKIANDEKILIYITGEVKNWGVIELEKGDRIIDAVNKAGGFTEEADMSKVNLAYELADGMQIYIPNKDEEKEIRTSTKQYITTESGNNVVIDDNNVKKQGKYLVNINEATQTELETLPGIGPSIALKIIYYREENGKFSSVEDIKNVSGIGENKFENIRELICI